MKISNDNGWEDNGLPVPTMKSKRNKLSEHELEELREHIDLISFDIGKVYHHARDRSRKELNRAKMSIRKKSLSFK